MERALAFYASHAITAKRLMTDNAFAYVKNRTLRELLRARGISHRTTAPYRPRTNGCDPPSAPSGAFAWLVPMWRRVTRRNGWLVWMPLLSAVRLGSRCRSGARCWPDQKPVRPSGVTHHSPAAAVSLPQTGTERPQLQEVLQNARRRNGLRHRSRHAPRPAHRGDRHATGGARSKNLTSPHRRRLPKLLARARRHAEGRRVWAIEGTGSYVAGLARFLIAQGERVVEIDRPRRREGRAGAKSDALDAIRAAREALGREQLATPRLAGQRDGLRALVMTREGAVLARTAAINQLRALIVVAPEPLRGELPRTGFR